MPRKRTACVPLALGCALVVATLASGSPVKRAARCAVFPRDNHWNVRVDGLPVASDSDRLVRGIGRDRQVHPDFGSGLWEGRPIGIPYTTVSRRQRRVRVSFDYADESDRGRYPIPKRAPIEGGRSADGDRHVIVVDRDRCKLYELYAAYPHDGGSRWTAGSGAIWSLESNRLRPRTWTSADAAGLPILPGLARWDEVKRQFQAAPGQVLPAREAVQHGRKGALGRFLLQDRGDVGVRIARVDDERQLRGARRRDVAAEALRLRRARAIVVKVVEAGLADRHHLGVRRQPHQLIEGDIELLVGIVRVRANRAKHGVVGLGDGDQVGQALEAGRDRDDGADAGGPSAGQHGAELIGKIGKVEVAVVIDEHQVFCGFAGLPLPSPPSPK